MLELQRRDRDRRFHRLRVSRLEDAKRGDEERGESESEFHGSFDTLRGDPLRRILKPRGRREPMGLTGLEPVTLRLSSACSNQLSYRPGRREASEEVNCDG